MFIFFQRVCVFACKNFLRNIGFSLITVLILVMTLVAFDVVLLVRGLTETAIKLVEGRVDVSLIFKPKAEESRVQEMRDLLSKMPSVAQVIYKTPEQVLAEFKERNKDDKDIMSALTEMNNNPLGGTLIVRAQNASDYTAILKTIDIPEYNAVIEKKTFDDNGPIIQRISAITGRTEQVSLAVGTILTIMAFLIIFNVIRLSIVSRGEEIGIMKLVGATNWFVRSPFLLEVTIYSVLAWLVNLGVIYGALRVTEPYFLRFFEGVDFSLIGYFNDNFLLFFGLELIGLVFLGILSAGLAMRRYLKI